MNARQLENELQHVRYLQLCAYASTYVGMGYGRATMLDTHHRGLVAMERHEEKADALRAELFRKTWRKK